MEIPMKKQVELKKRKNRTFQLLRKREAVALPSELLLFFFKLILFDNYATHKYMSIIM